MPPIHNSRIADITIPIKNYERPDIENPDNHHGERDYRTFPYFVGRKSVIKKLTDLLEATTYRGAAYLLVGARGMGKTTVVNKVIQDINKYFDKEKKGKRRHVKIAISLSNENFEEIDIYRIVGKRFIQKFLEEKPSKNGWATKKLDPVIISKIGRSIKVTAYSLISLLLVLFISSFLLTKISDFNAYQEWGPIQNALELLKNNFYLLSISLGVVIALFSLWLVSTKLAPSARGKLKKRAKALLERIEADITISQSADLGKKVWPFSLGAIKQKKYPIADIRFIEHELINLINKVKQLDKNREFVFVFDELDKIEFRGNNIQEERPYDVNEDTNQTRRQQKAVIDILGNFKYFLNHTRVKFIFIAGREMTDASLADVSKRDFYLRSIFDDIVYLDSLLKEDIELLGLRISSAVELYVHGIIIGETNFRKGDAQQLENFKRWEKLSIEEKAKVKLEFDYDFKGETADNVFKDADTLLDYSLTLIKKEYELDKAKNIYGIKSYEKQRYAAFIEDFILYLTFRSHGSPRLLFQYFEKYVHPCEEGEDKPYKLKFSFKQQAVIGFVAQLYRGLIQNFYNTTAGNSDKLLSNLPFIFDHILKFHDFAFSWRSLELLPEVIDVNKSPNLRTHVRTVVEYLRRSHVRSISNGLFEFKFLRSSANEIEYVSNISKTSRAAFNFTLDESLPLKQYYGDQIMRLKKDLSQTEPFGEYLHSLGFYYIILGDLHFYDKEYDKAIENYNNAVQPFRQKTLNNHKGFMRLRSHELIIYIRAMLKMNLTFERMKLYDSVFTYLEWTNRFIVNYFFLKKRKKYLKGLLNPKDFEQSNKYLLNNQQIFIDGLLNVLYVTEKASVQGMTEIELTVNSKRFKKLVGRKYELDFTKDDKWYFAMLKAHYNNQVGHLLFYKNGFLPGREIKDKVTKSEYKQAGHKNHDLSEAIYNSIVNEFELKINNQDKGIPKYLNIPISAYKRYYQSLNRVLKESRLNYQKNTKTLKDKEYYLISRYSEFLYKKDKLFPHNYSAHLFNWTAKYLADFGDTILCLYQNHEVNNESLMTVIGKINQSTDDQPNDAGLDDVFEFMEQKENDEKRFKGVHFVLLSYLSGLYYKRINKQREYAYALTKILYLIKYNASLHKKHLNRDQIKILFEKIAHPALKAACSNLPFQDVGAFLNTHDWDKFLDTLDDPTTSVDDNGYKHFIRFINHSEIKDIVIAFFEIVIASYKAIQDELKCSSNGSDQILENVEKILKKDLDRIRAADWVNEHTQLNHSFSRTMELRYKAYLNTIVDDPEALDVLADSLWCLRQVRTNLQVYGISYMTNYYFRAEASHEMARLLKKQELTDDDRRYLVDKLRTRYTVSMNEERMNEFLDPTHHMREALHNYRNTIQLHSQGESYYNNIRQMYYLEGDFDDESLHFCATLDRYRINTGIIAKRIAQCDPKYAQKVEEQVATGDKKNNTRSKKAKARAKRGNKTPK